MSQKSKLIEYAQLFKDGLITEDEFTELKREILLKDESFNSENSVTTNTTLFMVIGYISVAISLVFIPIIFAAVGVVMGFLVSRDPKFKTQGTILMIISIAAGLFGFVLGMAVSGY